MMITRESDYAIRMIRALKDGEQLTIEQICRKEQIPRQFAYKILKKLEKAGLVSIRRGAGGGCSLGRSLEGLTLLDIIHAADEEFFLTPCLKKGYHCEYASGDLPGQEPGDCADQELVGPPGQEPVGPSDQESAHSPVRQCTVHCELARIQRILEAELGRSTLDRLFGP